ncbi:MAG: hypothetical protein EXQ89_03660 [Rhodospirillaceae bacterium]|nr:hypothetical protein [Rhodospirillaceae bacterium]
MRRSLLACAVAAALAPLPAAAPAWAQACNPATAQSPVSFDRDIQRIFDLHCVECHGEGEPPANLVLDVGHAWSNLVDHVSMESDLLRVAPGASEKSYLWHKVRGTHLTVGGTGDRMPFDRAPVPDDMIAQLTAWIGDCAPNN